jgi:hypothetical protein
MVEPSHPLQGGIRARQSLYAPPFNPQNRSGGLFRHYTAKPPGIAAEPHPDGFVSALVIEKTASTDGADRPAREPAQGAWNTR